MSDEQQPPGEWCWCDEVPEDQESHDCAENHPWIRPPHQHDGAHVHPWPSGRDGQVAKLRAELDQLYAQKNAAEKRIREIHEAFAALGSAGD